MLPPVLAALCQHRWCHCTHTSSSHPLPLVHCSLLLTRTPKCGRANAHTQGSACAHIHTYRNMRTTTVGSLPSDNRHTETNQGVPLLKAHPFLTLHITENSFWPDPKPVGVVWLRERAVSWGESQLQVRGHAESGKRQPKVLQDEKFAFQMTAKDQTTLRSSGCVADAPLTSFRSSSYSATVSCPACPEGNTPGIPRSGREAKVEQDDPKLDTRPESESDTASSSNF